MQFMHYALIIFMHFSIYAIYASNFMQYSFYANLYWFYVIYATLFMHFSSYAIFIQFMQHNFLCILGFMQFMHYALIIFMHFSIYAIYASFFMQFSFYANL